MDPLSLLLEGDPQQADARALAEAMRRRSNLGTLLGMSGDKVIAPAGQGLIRDAAGQMDAMQQAINSLQGRRLQATNAAQAAQQHQAQLAQQADQFRQKLGLDRAEFDLKRQALNTPKPDPAPNPDELRKEFQGQQGYKDFRQVETAYRKIKSTSDTGAGDMSLIFGYMKLLDPNSTVREGEYATAAQAGSVPQSILAAYNKVITGEKLAPEVRNQFRAEAERVYGAQKSQFDELAKPYLRMASERGLKPEDVVLGYQPDPAAQAPAAPVRAQGKDGKWYVQTPAGWEAE